MTNRPTQYELEYRRTVALEQITVSLAGVLLELGNIKMHVADLASAVRTDQ